MYIDQTGQAGGLWKLDDLRRGWNRETGADALERGLVDEMGGLRRAVEIARSAFSCAAVSMCSA